MVKNIFIRLLILMVFLLAAAGAFIAHEWCARPLYINNFFNRVALKIALERPEILTSLHFLEAIGIDGHNAELDDVSPESLNQLLTYLASEYEVLKSYKHEDLTQDEKVSKRIAEYLLEFAKEVEPFKLHNYPVNQLFGIQSGFPAFMQSKHQLNSFRDAQFYVSRLKKLPNKFSQSLQGIKLRTEQGIIPPRFVIEKVVEEMQSFFNTEVEDNILYTSLKEKLNQLDSIEQAEKEKILNQTKTAIIDDVYPAYVEMADYFKQLSPKADDKDGYWKLPNGDEAYRLALKFFTTTDYTPDYIHNIGLQEVARIQQEIVDILEKEGFDITMGFYESIELLSKQDRFYYPDTVAGREQILKDYQHIIDEVDSGLDQAFNSRPEAKVKVERIPGFMEKNSPGAYYNGPALDGSRPGIFYANLYDVKATPKYGMRTLAYHEAIPGHHFQVAIAQELQDIPVFRKFGPFTAYVEGWALYAERVAWELGFQSEPYDNIGRLQAELFRAVRLVVDTGIHAKRWNRLQAIDYMVANTGMAESDVVIEVERYIVMPGQACAYKVGMMKILELRAKAKKSLRNRFQLAEFHDVLLTNGALPLDILEELVDRYLQEKK